MNLSCTLELGAPFAEIEPLLRTEIARAHERSTLGIEDSDGTKITITANDVSALRAAINGVASILKVYEATHGHREDA